MATLKVGDTVKMKYDSLEEQKDDERENIEKYSVFKQVVFVD